MNMTIIREYPGVTWLVPIIPNYLGIEHSRWNC